MKNLLLGFVCCCFVNVVFGQKVHFTDTTNRWKTHYLEGGYITYAEEYVYDVKMGRDTIVRGKSYKVLTGTATKYYVPGSSSTLSGTNYWEMGLYREDTSAKKVWGILFRNMNDTAERIIYDGNWQVGDSIPGNYQSAPGKSRVAGKDSTFFLNEWYQVFHMTDSAGRDEYDIIEGIGSTCGPSYPLIGYRFETAWSLGCFSNNGNSPVISPELGKYNHFNNTTSCKMLGISESVLNSSLIVVPNPGNKDIVMKLPSGLRGGRLVITDGIGRRILEISIDNAAQINIGQYLRTEGVYYYTLQDRLTGQRYTGRFIYR